MVFLMRRSRDEGVVVGSCRRRHVKTALAGATALVAACAGTVAAGTTSPASAGTQLSTLTIANESGELWSCDFNPYNAADNFLSFGAVYQSLEFIDTMDNAKVTPMLATGYAWSNGDKTLTFTVRSGIKWTDGSDFSAADVVYSFGMLKKYPSLDLNSVWSVLTSVKQQGADRVVFTFRQPSVPFFYYIADQVPIVSEGVWSKVADPETYADSQPVGTGPYVVSRCSPQNIEYTKNTHYWQPGLPHIDVVNYPSFTSNYPANEELATGEAQWGSQFIPNIKAFYLSKSPSYHYWGPPLTNIYLFTNLTVAPLNDLAVRKAISFAIDRARVSAIGEEGINPPANQTGTVTPTFNSWFDGSLASKYGYGYDPAKARKVLADAGFKPGPGGVDVNARGQHLAFTVINIGGNSDWVSDLSIISSELKAVGISVTVQNLSSTTYESDLYAGRYQIAYGYEPAGGPTPYYELRDLLDSANTAPVGQLATSNFERYRSATADALFDQYASTTNLATQRRVIDQVEKLMLSEVPVVPVDEFPAQSQYDTAKFSGWATPSDPYAEPAAYNLPDWGVQLANLRPK